MIHKTEEGFVSFHKEVWNENAIYVSKLYVRPDYRGNKAGYKLLDHVKQYAKDNGFSLVYLDVFPFECHNLVEEHIRTEQLIKYYKAYGFKQSKTTRTRMRMKI